MKNSSLFSSIFLFALLFCSACTMTPKTTAVSDPVEEQDTLYVYEDGRMQFNSRFVNDDDVVIYSDGRGSERAAIKVRVPIHPDFYRDSILVVRVENKFDESISQQDVDEVDNIN
jgi:hypothetical protein